MNSWRDALNRPATTNLLLLVIAIAFAAIALRPYIAPDVARADSGTPYPFYIEPGTQTLRAPDGSRQLLGRMVVDMRNGNVWGFPTFTGDVYPVNTMGGTPPVSHPFLLARFAFEDTAKGQ